MVNALFVFDKELLFQIWFGKQYLFRHISALQEMKCIGLNFKGKVLFSREKIVAKSPNTFSRRNKENNL